MVWNDNGENMGPWGKPKRPGNNASNVTNLDDVLQKGQDNLKKIMGGGPGSGGYPILLFVFVGLVLWILTGVYRVREGEQAVVTRFGAVVRTLGPGLHYHIPTPVEDKYVVKVAKVNILNSGVNFTRKSSSYLLRGENVQDLMLTGDENIIKLRFTVHWFINDIGKFVFNDPNPIETVKVAAESAVREVIAQTTLAEALTVGKDKIIRDSKLLLQKLLNEYNIGVEVVKINLEEVNPPGAVIDSFRDVQRAKADSAKIVNEAKAYRNSIIPVARGEAQQIVKHAEAKKEELINIAKGETARFLSVLKEYLKAPDVTLARLRIQNSEKTLKDVPKYVISGSDAANSVLPHLPLNKSK